jgi:hypothetical protein
MRRRIALASPTRPAPVSNRLEGSGTDTGPLPPAPPVTGAVVMEVAIGAFAGLAGPAGPPATTPDGFSTDGPDGALDDELLGGALLAEPLLDDALPLELLFGPPSDRPPSKLPTRFLKSSMLTPVPATDVMSGRSETPAPTSLTAPPPP